MNQYSSIRLRVPQGAHDELCQLLPDMSRIEKGQIFAYLLSYWLYSANNNINKQFIDNLESRFDSLVKHHCVPPCSQIDFEFNISHIADRYNDEISHCLDPIYYILDEDYSFLLNSHVIANDCVLIIY